MLVTSGAVLLQPWPLKLVVDSVLGDRPIPFALAEATDAIVTHSPVAIDPKLALLVILCVAVLAIQGVVGILNVLSTYVLVAVGLRMVFRLRCRLFDHLQKLSLSFHDATPIGDSLYRVTWDTYSAQTLFNSGIVPAVTAAVTLVGIAFVMLALDCGDDPGSPGRRRAADAPDPSSGPADDRALAADARAGERCQRADPGDLDRDPRRASVRAGGGRERALQGACGREPASQPPVNRLAGGSQGWSGCC